MVKQSITEQGTKENNTEHEENRHKPQYEQQKPKAKLGSGSHIAAEDR
jgi:hypothetical protein